MQRFLHSQSFPVDTNLILFLTTSPLSLSLFLKTHLVPITNWFLRVCSWFQTLFFVNRLSSSSIVVAQEISLSVSSFFYSSIVERSVAFLSLCFQRGSSLDFRCRLSNDEIWRLRGDKSPTLWHINFYFLFWILSFWAFLRCLKNIFLSFLWTFWDWLLDWEFGWPLLSLVLFITCILSSTTWVLKF